jgi:LacI family transcriptional regulator
MGRTPKDSITIADVARAAEVSRATVSRVMNGRLTVAPEIAERVRAAADRLNYRPSDLARSLSLGRTNMVALVVPDLGNPLFQQILRGITHASAAAGYRVLVAETDEDPSAEADIAVEARRRCDALIMVSPRIAEESLLELLPQVRPVILVNRQGPPEIASVGVDFGRAVRMVVDHLVGLGHRRLAYLAGPPASTSNRARLRSLEVAEREIPGLEIVRQDCGSSIEDGYAAVERVLESHVTAVVAFNDLVAFGLLARLNEIGVAVPADLSVAGMDDIGLSRFAVPSLTTVRVPQQGLGELAWRRLYSEIAGSEAEVDGVPDLRLALRASTGPVPQATRLLGDAPRGQVGPVRWQQQGDIFVLGSDSGLLAHYEFGRRMPQVHSPRPHLHPVRTLGGQPLTEVSPVDHRHHYGVSVAVAGVNGTSHWGGRTFLPGRGPTLLTNHGQQRSRGVTVDREAGNSLTDDITWYDEQGRPQLVERRRLSGTLAEGGWRLDWNSVLTARYGPIRIDSPATAGRPGAGYGGIFWRLPSAENTVVLSEFGEGTDAAYGSLSQWLAFVQQRGDSVTTLLLVQPAADKRPWFLRSTDYVGAGPALAWESALALQPDQDLSLSLTALLLDRSIDLAEAPALASRLADPL